MWMKVDDGLHAHRKTRNVTKSHDEKRRDAAPMGLWVLAGSWAAQNATDGWVPEDELDRWDDDWPALTARLVAAGYWWPVKRDDEPGYGFTDWHDYNDPADSASKAGTFGNHVRWHVNEKRVDPECVHCPKEPEDHPDIAPESGGDRGATSPPIRGAIAGAIALPDPNPNPTRTRPDPIVSATPPDAPPRDDVERICQHLAARIEGNGAKRPPITKGWRDAARLMLDRDNLTEADIHAAIDWCQDHEFWRANVLSLPKLREKYQQLRLQASRPSGAATKQQQTDDLFSRAAVRMGVIQGGQS